MNEQPLEATFKGRSSEAVWRKGMKWWHSNSQSDRDVHWAEEWHGSVHTLTLRIEPSECLVCQKRL